VLPVVVAKNTFRPKLKPITALSDHQKELVERDIKKGRTTMDPVGPRARES